MRYKLFGRSGLRVSEICLGTGGFGLDAKKLGLKVDWGSCDEQESRAIFDAYADAGGNFIDTASVYADGASETIVGQLIKSDRDHFVLGTKYTQSFGSDISKSGNSRKNMLRSVEESLRRLSTDHIDLLWLHNWDFSTPMDEILRTFDDLVSAGKIAYVAASNVEAWRLSSANTLADLRGWAPFIGIQICYSLTERTAERDLLPMAKALDLGIAAWSPLDGGVLTGKYSGSSVTTGARLAGQIIPPRKLEIAKLVRDVSNERGCTPTQVALAWLRQRKCFSNAVIPIMGARNVAQLRDSLRSVEIDLSQEQLGRLNAVSAIDMGYLNDFLTSPGFGARELSYSGQFDRVDNHRK
jgi:aryl-alcohol dehydrogenase-like predicted oxidoreductase